jgi:hypothetical protein
MWLGAGASWRRRSHAAIDPGGDARRDQAGDRPAPARAGLVMADPWQLPVPRQRLAVVLTLRGLQDTAVVAHHPRTDEAAVSVRIGRMLLYFREWVAAAAVTRGWREFSHHAAGLPLVSRPGSTSVRPDAIQAATTMDVVGTPQISGYLRAPEGMASWLVVKIDQLGLVIHDRNAYASTRQAFVDAEALCDRVLPRPAVPDLRVAAMKQVERALSPPPRVTGRSRQRFEAADRRPAPRTARGPERS